MTAIYESLCPLLGGRGCIGYALKVIMAIRIFLKIVKVIVTHATLILASSNVPSDVINLSETHDENRFQTSCHADTHLETVRQTNQSLVRRESTPYLTKKEYVDHSTANLWHVKWHKSLIKSNKRHIRGCWGVV